MRNAATAAFFLMPVLLFANSQFDFGARQDVDAVFANRWKIFSANDADFLLDTATGTVQRGDGKTAFTKVEVVGNDPKSAMLDRYAIAFSPGRGRSVYLLDTAKGQVWVLRRTAPGSHPRYRFVPDDKPAPTLPIHREDMPIP